MNTDLILMLGTLVLLAISGLLVFCFTESKGKNTPHARRVENEQLASKKAKSQGEKQISTHHIATHHMSAMEDKHTLV